jgi:polygalacturonase
MNNQKRIQWQAFLLVLFCLWSCEGSTYCASMTESAAMSFNASVVSTSEQPILYGKECGKILNVVHFGADPTGSSLSNLAVEWAFQAASETVGATILFPRGTYLLQPLQLSYSNINIHFEEGAVWKAVQDEEYILRPSTYSRDDPLLYYKNEKDYDTSTDVNQRLYYWPITPAMVTYGGGREDGRPMRYEAFFSLTGVENVTLSGQGGIINGGGPVWWYLYNRRALPFTRPSLVEVRHSNNIVVKGIRLEESPFWTLHFYNNTNVLVHDIHIHNEMFGEYEGVEYSSQNVDGIDINSCRHVVIKDSVIHTHDDAIVVKSGLDLAGLNAALPSYDILMHNLTTKATVGGGLSIGSEVSGGISNVTFSNCTVYDSMYGIRIKTAHGRGSRISNITFQDINIITNPDAQYGQTYAIQLSMFGGNRPSIFKGFRWSDITTIDNVLFHTITIFPSDYKMSNALRSNSDASMDEKDWKPSIDPAALSAIYIMGDTNLRRYWFSPFRSASSNEFIRNVSFRNLINHATDDFTIISNNHSEIPMSFSKKRTTVTTTTSSASSTADVRIPSNLYCSNAAKIQFDGHEISCQDKPYAMISYDLDQIGKVIRHAFQRALGRRRF